MGPRDLEQARVVLACPLQINRPHPPDPAHDRFAVAVARFDKLLAEVVGESGCRINVVDDAPHSPWSIAVLREFAAQRESEIG